MEMLVTKFSKGKYRNEAYGLSELIRLFSALDTFILRVSINLCLYENVIERFFIAVFEHPLKCFAVVVGTRRGAVDVGADNDDAVSLREFPADPYLTFYRLFGLIIAAVACIDFCCFHVVPPKDFWSIVEIKLAAFLRL